MLPSRLRISLRRGWVRSCRAALIVLLVPILAPHANTFAQSRALTVSRNLGELVTESQTIIQGQITGVTLEPSAQFRNLMTVAVTLRVDDTLKGLAGQTYTFHQAVIDKRDQREKMGYRTGQRVLLILIQPSPFGLTSPAGMEQGRFRLENGQDGKLLAANGIGNTGLFHNLNSQLRARGMRVAPEIGAMLEAPGAHPVPLERLKTLIRTLAGTPQSQ